MPLPAKSMRPASQDGGGGGKDSEESVTPSNNLWVGNLAPDVTDSDLMELFAQYGALDSVTSYSLRSYAFVYFKRVEDAKAAKNALQGFSFRGNYLKIEFARPVCSHHLCALTLNFTGSCIFYCRYKLHRIIIALRSKNWLPKSLDACKSEIPIFINYHIFLRIYWTYKLVVHAIDAKVDRCTGNQFTLCFAKSLIPKGIDLSR